ncbi:MAG: AMP-binding protein, partial [Bacillota bacterium]
MKTATELFKESRDFLISHRTEYEIAYKNYRRPQLENFNWALDWFDVLAKNNTQTALWIVRNHHGQWLDQKISYQEMSSRSSKVARYLQKLGMKRGDAILIMLPNVLPLWETILAVMKLGGIVVPTSTQATETDLQDRVQRGLIKFILTDAEGSEKVEKSNITSPLTLILTGAEQTGWKNYESSLSETEDFVVEGFSKATDPFLLYFTSGTTAKPKLVLHTHQSYPVGHLSTMYWIGIQEGDVHQNISSPGWAKHAWSSFFAPWNAGATILVHDYSRFNAKESLEVLSRCQVNTLCAPPTVWRMLILENLGQKPPHLRELVGAGEPLNPEIIDVVQNAWGLQIRDGFGQTETTAQIGNSPGQRVKLGSMGRPLPGYVPVLLNEKEEEALEGEIALKLSPERPLGLMQGYQDDPERTAKVMAHGYYRTGDEASLDEEG